MNDFDKNCWVTPPHIIEAARAAMGGIDLDPCSSTRAQEIVQARRYYDKSWPGADGLLVRWSPADKTWMNPPYGKGLIEPWIDRVLGQETFCVLVNGAHETEWGQKLLKYSTAVCMMAGRLAFLHPETLTPKRGNRYNQLVAYRGASVYPFANAFQKYGVVYEK